MRALIDAINDRWNKVPALAALAPGGLWITQAPAETPTPLVVMTMGDTSEQVNSQAYLYAAPVTFTCVAAATVDDASDVVTLLAQAVADAFRDVPLTLETGTWRASDQQGAPKPDSDNGDREYWLCTVDFQFGWQESRT